MATNSSESRFILPNGFGNVGVHTVERRADFYTVRRTIDVHAVDMEINLPKGNAFPWRPVSDTDSLEFLATVPAGTWGTLAGLADNLRSAQRARNGIDSDDPRLQILKDVYQQLIIAASEAHRQGCRLGLLDPTNVLFVTDHVSAKTHVVLPDVGFVWKKGLSIPNHLTSTRWGAPPNVFTEYERLWYPYKTLVDAETLGDHRTETIALGRMLAWVLCGRIVYEKPRQLPTDVNSAAYRTWQVLQKFVDSNSAPENAAALMQPLRGVPFWKSFTDEPIQRYEVDQKRAGQGIRRFAVVLLLLIILATGISYHFRESLINMVPEPFPPKPLANGVCPECNAPGAFRNVLAEIDGDEGSFMRLSRILDDGLVSGTIMPIWRRDTPPKSIGREDFRELETKHFAYVAELLHQQMDAVKRLQNLAEPNDPAQSACVDRLALQLRDVIDRTDSLMQWSEYYDRGLDKNVMEKIARVALELKTDFHDSLRLEKEQWPTFLRNYPFGEPAVSVDAR